MKGIVGIDGCKTGWIFAWSEGDRLQFKVLPTISDLNRFPTVEMVVIDIPIGLPFKGIQKRACATVAREKLGFPRSASVFRPPCRNTVQVTGFDSEAYREACAINDDEVGYKLSKRASASAERFERSMISCMLSRFGLTD